MDTKLNDKTEADYLYDMYTAMCDKKPYIISDFLAAYPKHDHQISKFVRNLALYHQNINKMGFPYGRAKFMEVVFGEGPDLRQVVIACFAAMDMPLNVAAGGYDGGYLTAASLVETIHQFLCPECGIFLIGQDQLKHVALKAKAMVEDAGTQNQKTLLDRAIMQLNAPIKDQIESMIQKINRTVSPNNAADLLALLEEKAHQLETLATTKKSTKQ